MIVFPTFHGTLVRAPATAGFNPASTSPSIWLDASTNAYLYTADAGGSLVTAGQAIGRWEDRSGNARHYTQATAGARPIFRSSGQNSFGFVEFTNHWLLSTAALSVLNNASGTTAIMALKYRSLQTSFNNAVWIARNTAANSARLGFGTGAAGTAQQHCIARRSGDPSLLNYITGSTAFQIHSARINHSAALMDHYRDGVVINANVATGLGTGAVDNFNSQRVSIGSHDGITFAPVDISEIFIWSRALTDTEIANMHNWILTKYIPI
jgi:hypothetical protein